MGLALNLWSRYRWVVLLGVAGVSLLILRWLNHERQGGKGVIVYVAQDQVYAEPILAEFSRRTGIDVRTVFDSEAVKTVGLANRLLAERSHPRADVFWGNEELRTRQLARAGVFRETNGWASFGFRSRRLVVNTNRLALTEAPRSMVELTNPVWRRKLAMAYPMFGTTATHFSVLRAHWGESVWLTWCRALRANEPFVVDGNSVVVKLVARGEALVGLTDSDDVAAEQRSGAAIMAMPLEDHSLLIPNTVGVVRGAPHPEAAQALFGYLGSREVVERLIESRALEGIEPAEGIGLRPDWDLVLNELETTTRQLREIFLR